MLTRPEAHARRTHGRRKHGERGMVVVLLPAASAKDDDARWGKAKKQIAAPARPHASSMADRCVVKRGQMASGNDSEQTRTLVTKDNAMHSGLLGGLQASGKGKFETTIGPTALLYQIATPTCNRSSWTDARTIGLQVMQRHHSQRVGSGLAHALTDAWPSSRTANGP